VVTKEKDKRPKDHEVGPPQVAVTAAAQATESSQFRDALHLLSRYISKSEDSKNIEQAAAQQRDFFKQEMFLSNDELVEAESVPFRPLDSHYLECCALLRDAARGLEKPDGSPLDVARHAQGWVCRQVLLAAPKDPSWLPSDVVLRMGYGNARDRALLFLALLRQVKLPGDERLEGCVIDSPDSSYPLVGVLLPSDLDNLYLFDMMLGGPLAGPKGEGVATLAQVRKDPELLKAAGVPQKSFDSGEYYLNCPLSAAAPRMKMLESWLKEQERTVLYLDVVGVHKAVAKAAQKPVRAGNAPPQPGQPPRNSPTRIMRWFQLPEEGGQEFSPQDPELLQGVLRRARFELQQRRRPQLLANLRALKLIDPSSTFVPKEAGDQLLKEALDVMLKFSVQPRDMMLRGQTAALLKRLNRVGRALEESELMDPAEFQSDVASWRVQAKEAYLAVQRRMPKANHMMDALWNDSYFDALTNVNVDFDPKKFQEPAKIGEVFDPSKPAEKKPRRKMITRMVFTGCKDVLDQNVAYLWAMSFHEESEALQAAADSMKPSSKYLGAARQRAAESWPNAVSYWNKFVERFALSPTSVRERLDSMRRAASSQIVNLDDLPNILQEWSRSCYARLSLARVLQRQGQDQTARTLLDGLAQDLESMAKDADLQKDLDSYLRTIQNARDLGPLVEYPRSVSREFQGDTLVSLRRLVELYRQ